MTQVGFSFQNIDIPTVTFDGLTVSVSDSPRADEILVAIAVTDGGRPHPRVGGLKKEEAKGEDGLR